MAHTSDVIIVGAGIFGVTAALSLAERGYTVTVLNPESIPHPLASSTDISKVVRMEYGSDEGYMAMIEAALPGWRQWNEQMPEPLYHETGVTMVTTSEMTPGGYEHDSYQLLLKRGHTPERLNADELSRRFPAWHNSYIDGFYHHQGGYAQSGRVVEAVMTMGERAGVTYITEQTAQTILKDGDTVQGVKTQEGDTYHADKVIVAAGAWTPLLVPELAPMTTITGHPVFHLKPPQPELFQPPSFSVFTADVARTGWYGFPLHPVENVVKIANHGPGQQLHPINDERVVTTDDTARLRKMLATTFPSLKEAEIVYTRRCLYCDTHDGDLWIDRHPEVDGLTIATGGSGHGFKFAPILGDIIADAVEANDNQWLPRFRWRDLDTDSVSSEPARYLGD